jgi:hypothetical protein
MVLFFKNNKKKMSRNIKTVIRSGDDYYINLSALYANIPEFGEKYPTRKLIENDHYNADIIYVTQTMTNNKEKLKMHLISDECKITKHIGRCISSSYWLKHSSSLLTKYIEYFTLNIDSGEIIFNTPIKTTIDEQPQQTLTENKIVEEIQYATLRQVNELITQQLTEYVTKRNYTELYTDFQQYKHFTTNKLDKMEIKMECVDQKILLLRLSNAEHIPYIPPPL